MKILPVMPILLPMAVAILSVLLRGDEKRAHRLAMAGAVVHLRGGIAGRTRLAVEFAVPWSGDVRTIGRPSVRFTASRQASSFTGISPWS